VLREAIDATLAGGPLRSFDDLDVPYPPMQDSSTSAATRIRSAVVVPLQARGRTIGALTLAVGPSGRRLGPAEIALAEDLAGRAAMALDNARLYKQVETADRQKNEFLSMLAHELRNPLAPIRNAAEVLRLKAPDQPQVRWAREIIDRQTAHLVRLVDDLLDVSRITKGKIRLIRQPTDLTEVLTVAIEASRPLIEQLHHKLEVLLPADRVRIVGDPARLAQVFTNLLNNAAKYTEEGGRITLSAECTRPGAESKPDVPGPAPHPVAHTSPPAFVEVRIRDTGVGIPPDMLAAVFDLFIQADRSLERAQGGLGIGLTLVKRLIEMHDGTVEARSDGPGKGSEFVVRLPLAPDATPAPTPPGASLTLDDRPDNGRAARVATGRGAVGER
jgi:signal transduction histidine kinase